jgi:hypothetical protein
MGLFAVGGMWVGLQERLSNADETNAGFGGFKD